MIDFDYTAPELIPFRVQEVRENPEEPHKIGGIVYVPTCGKSENTHWYKLFGTPERAAQLIADNCEYLDYCGQCWVRAANCDGNYSTVLEWLRGDAE